MQCASGTDNSAAGPNTDRFVHNCKDLFQKMKYKIQ